MNASAITRTAVDPISGQQVEIRNDLTKRLRGEYACGPTLPNGEPEFGWRKFDAPPIQREAASAIDTLTEENTRLSERVKELEGALKPFAKDLLLGDLPSATVVEAGGKIPRKKEWFEIVGLTVGDFHRASSAYSNSKHDQGVETNE